MIAVLARPCLGREGLVAVRACGEWDVSCMCYPWLAGARILKCMPLPCRLGAGRQPPYTCGMAIAVIIKHAPSPTTIWTVPFLSGECRALIRVLSHALFMFMFRFFAFLA